MNDDLYEKVRRQLCDYHGQTEHNARECVSPGEGLDKLVRPLKRKSGEAGQ